MSNHRRPVNALFAAALPVLLLAGATAAQAHMPYVLPTLFDAGKADHVTVTSAFAEDAFVPEVAMRDAVGDNDDLRWVARGELTSLGIPAPIRRLLTGA